MDGSCVTDTCSLEWSFHPSFASRFLYKPVMVTAPLETVYLKSAMFWANVAVAVRTFLFYHVLLL